MGRAINAISPTQAALEQNIQRAAYQARHCWSQFENQKFHFQMTGGWSKKPKEEVEKRGSVACRELVCGGCKKVVGEDASVDWLPHSVLLFATVVGLR